MNDLFNRVKDAFSRISREEVESLLEHLKTAWRSEELVPRPEGYIMIPMERIDSPENPIRKDLGEIGELRESIDREDILQPIGVRPKDKEWRRFEPFVGLRRYYACRELGREEIPSYIREIEDDELASIVLEENVFRKDLEPPEFLSAILELRKKGYTQERIAQKADKSQSDVSAYLRIPNLPESIKEAFFRGKISLDHVKILLNLDDESRAKLFERIEEEGLSVPDSRAVAKLMTGKLEVPEFFDKAEFESRLGKNVDFKNSSWGTSFAVKAEDLDEFKEILKRILRVERLE